MCLAAAAGLIPVLKLILVELACRVSLYNSTLHCIGKPLRSMAAYVCKQESTVVLTGLSICGNFICACSDDQRPSFFANVHKRIEDA